MYLARHALLASPFLVAFTAVACGQGNATLSPTGPTASLDGFALSADATAGSESVTTLDRGNNGKGGGDSEEKQDQEKEAKNGPPEKGSRGELSGFVTAANGTSLTVRGIDVTPAPDAVIRHGNRILLFASIAIGDHVQARGSMVDGKLVATEIKVENTGRADDDDDEGEVQGVVSGITVTTGCPVLTFMVGTTTVTTSAATDFDGGLCTALANGAIVEVEGALQADGSIVATKVEQD